MNYDIAKYIIVELIMKAIRTSNLDTLYKVLLNIKIKNTKIRIDKTNTVIKSLSYWILFAPDLISISVGNSALVTKM